MPLCLQFHLSPFNDYIIRFEVGSQLIYFHLNNLISICHFCCYCFNFFSFLVFVGFCLCNDVNLVFKCRFHKGQWSTIIYFSKVTKMAETIYQVISLCQYKTYEENVLIFTRSGKKKEDCSWIKTISLKFMGANKAA